MTSELAFLIVAFASSLTFSLGALYGGWMRDRAWREKAYGPSRMLSGGRFYQVLTSEAYEDLTDYGQHYQTLLQATKGKTEDEQ